MPSLKTTNYASRYRKLIASPMSLNASCADQPKHKPSHTSSGFSCTSIRRPAFYWEPLNSWWRLRYADLGHRPAILEVQQWYEKNFAKVWSSLDRPSWEETRVHTNCLRSKEQVAHYFRVRRARCKVAKSATVRAAESDDKVNCIGCYYKESAVPAAAAMTVRESVELVSSELDTWQCAIIQRKSSSGFRMQQKQQVVKSSSSGKHHSPFARFSSSSSSCLIRPSSTPILPDTHLAAGPTRMLSSENFQMGGVTASASPTGTFFQGRTMSTPMPILSALALHDGTTPTPIIINRAITSSSDFVSIFSPPSMRTFVPPPSRGGGTPMLSHPHPGQYQSSPINLIKQMSFDLPSRAWSGCVYPPPSALMRQKPHIAWQHCQPSPFSEFTLQQTSFEQVYQAPEDPMITGGMPPPQSKPRHGTAYGSHDVQPCGFSSFAMSSI